MILVPLYIEKVRIVEKGESTCFPDTKLNALRLIFLSTLRAGHLSNTGALYFQSCWVDKFVTFF